MRAPRCWRQLLAAALVAVILPAPVYAIASSTGEPASLRNGAEESAASDQQAVNRELELFRGSTISLSQATSASAINESAKAFINKLDAAIRSGRQAEIAALIVPGELIKFVRGAVGTQPESWQTNVLRSEQLDADHLALDVALNTKQLGVEHSGTAVYILARVGGSWKLNTIEYFEVR